jgi:protein-tyrosine kinase
MSGAEKPGKPKLTLIERAAQVYDFNAAMRLPDPVVVPEEPPVAAARQASPDPAPAQSPVASSVAAASLATPLMKVIDRASLQERGYIDIKAPATALSEEFRIIKRQLLTELFEVQDGRNPLVLINSAHPGDGKTWMAINLALSLSAETDLEVLLIDGDFANPDCCLQLGLPTAPGLMDALLDPSLDVEQMIIPTDIANLSVLPAGRQVNNDTEVLAADRTRDIFAQLVAARPRRIILMDSPPALAASAASELARHAGLVLLVVRADRTSEVALRDAVHLLKACPTIRSVLNGVKFSSSGRLFGAYYGKRSS